MKSSWVISHVKCLYETNVFRAISVLIIKDLILVSYRCLMQVTTPEDFTEYISVSLKLAL